MTWSGRPEGTKNVVHVYTIQHGISPCTAGKRLVSITIQMVPILGVSSLLRSLPPLPSLPISRHENFQSLPLALLPARISIQIEDGPARRVSQLILCFGYWGKDAGVESTCFFLSFFIYSSSPTNYFPDRMRRATVWMTKNEKRERKKKRRVEIWGPRQWGGVSLSMSLYLKRKGSKRREKLKGNY